MNGDFIIEGKRIKTSLKGKSVLTIPQLNKGTAFSLSERERFELIGKLPDRVESLEEQSLRAYQQFCGFEKDFEKFIFLNSLHGYNQTLYYYLIKKHIDEMVPIIYTPLVGYGVEQFSAEFRSTRGLYISYDNQDIIETILNNRTNSEIDLIVVSDGQGVLGIGDQGIGGLVISVAKLSIYSIFGAIDPNKTLPIILDVGTDNEKLLSNPFYLGIRKNRISQEKYDQFISKFVQAVKKVLPKAFLHWEDFGRSNAERILKKYRSHMCTFNDDSQGTGVVALAAILSGLKQQNTNLLEAKFVVFGAGTAGTGIALHIVNAMVARGLRRELATSRIYLIDKNGLISHNSKSVTPEQNQFIKESNAVSLNEVLAETSASVLIGTSAAPKTFTQQTIEIMCERNEKPLVLILSNPTSKMEAHPSEVIQWSQGRAMVACGSPCDNVNYNETNMVISQCNNFLTFPGIGLATAVVKPRLLTDEMLLEASIALSDFSDANSNNGLLPTMSSYREVTCAIAVAIAKYAIINELAQNAIEVESVLEMVESAFWEPEYLDYDLIS